MSNVLLSTRCRRAIRASLWINCVSGEQSSRILSLLPQKFQYRTHWQFECCIINRQQNHCQILIYNINDIKNLLFQYFITVGQDRPGIESRWGRANFLPPCTDRPWDPTSLLYNGYWLFFWSAREGVKRPWHGLTSYHHLAHRLKKECIYFSILYLGLHGPYYGEFYLSPCTWYFIPYDRNIFSHKNPATLHPQVMIYNFRNRQPTNRRLLRHALQYRWGKTTVSNLLL